MVNAELFVRAADQQGDPERLAAFMGARPGQPLLERHFARPRHRADFARVAERNGELVGGALLSHERLRLGAATLDVGRIDSVVVAGGAQADETFEELLGDCLGVLSAQGLPLALVRGAAERFAPYGWVEYRFESTLELASVPPSGAEMRRATEEDSEELAALYEATYARLPLRTLRVAPDWRYLLASAPDMWVLEQQSRVAAYALYAPRTAATRVVAEAAAADAGVARALVAALRTNEPLTLRLHPAHMVAQAALHMGGVVHLRASATEPELAGVVDLPLLLRALAPECAQRLLRSRYADWRGTIGIETANEQVVLAVDEHIHVPDDAPFADVRLRRVTLPALAQLCLGYRSAADLRATGDLACDDTALGLIDTLFPVIINAA